MKIRKSLYPTAMKNTVTIPVLILLLSGTARVWAQGPVQPEAMQFEPVDATDVVNLATGDFVYTVPLMEVPGPEGGYPIVLSYHSGIGPNQPATWVGLGWTLNPGAVNRTLSGYPDDYKAAKVTTHVEASDKKGFGIILAGGYGNIGGNMTFDTEAGFGGAVYYHYAYNSQRAIYNNAVLGVQSGATIGLSSSNGFSLYESLSITNRSNKNISQQLNLDGGNAEVQASINFNSVGAGLSSKKAGASFMVMGMNAGVINYNVSGNLESSSVNTTRLMRRIGSLFNIPWVGVGYSRWRWSLNETESEPSYGAMYKKYDDNSVKNERALLSVPYFTETGGSAESYMMPSKDVFTVGTQGLSGLFRVVDKYSYGMYDGSNNEDKGQIVGTPKNIVPRFRFLGDQGYNFVDQGGASWAEDYVPLNENRFSGKNIRYITGEAGNVIGFRIFQTDGMVYEFKKYVTNYYQFSKSGTNDRDDYVNWTELNTSYATSWLLTAVTGPDYVDRNEDGIPNDGDWGYWVRLTYTNHGPRKWRAPFTGEAALGSESATHFSEGIKDQVYLESIETATHKAVFHSSFSKNGIQTNAPFERSPGKKTELFLSDANELTFKFQGDYSWITQVINDVPGIANATFLSVDKCRRFMNGNEPTLQCVIPVNYTFSELNSFSYNPHSDVTTITVSTPSCESPPGHPCLYRGTIRLYDIASEITLGTKKLDRIELINKQLNQKIKSIEFEYDYHLRPGSNGSSATTTDGASGGVLALRKLSFSGLNDTPASPPYRFSYTSGGLNPSYHKNDIDIWGKYRYTGGEAIRGDRNRKIAQNKSDADRVAAWNLNKIDMPSGSTLEIEYESDDYYHLDGSLNYMYARDFPIEPWTNGARTIEILGTIDTDFFESELDVVIIKYDKTLYDYYNQYNIPGAGSVRNRIVSFNQNTNEIVLQESLENYDSDYDYYLVVAPSRVFGGGSRVRKLTQVDGRSSYATLYTYLDGNKSSGTTASLIKPNELEHGHSLDIPFSWNPKFMDYDEAFNRPAPSVIYSKVQTYAVNSQSEVLSGMTEFQFYTSNDIQFSAENTFLGVFNNLGVPEYRYDINIEDNTGIYGSPKEVTYFEQIEGAAENTFRKVKTDKSVFGLSTELMNYANISSKDNDVNAGLLGATQQVYYARQDVTLTSGNPVVFKSFFDVLYNNIFVIENISREYEYDTDTSLSPSDSLERKYRNIAFDMSTGQPVASASQVVDEEETYITRITPAWWKYNNDEVGFDDMYDKNMLTQTFEHTTYRANIGIDNLTGLKSYGFPGNDVIASTVTTWNPNPEFLHQACSHSGCIDFYQTTWRKDNTYSYHLGFTYSPFPGTWLDSGGPSYPFAPDYYPAANDGTPWEMTSNILEYDNFGHVIESVNKDGTYNTVLYDQENHSLVKAVISNARLNEIGYYDFEDGTGNTTNARTGKYAEQDREVEFTAPEHSPVFGARYKAGAWVKSDRPFEVNGTTYAGSPDWQFVVAKIDPDEDFQIFDADIVDDVTIIPEYASISYFAYDPLTWKVTAMTGPDHRTIFYEYDDAGRLVFTRDFEGNILTKNEYGFGNDIGITDNRSGVATAGSSVTFTPVHALDITSYSWDFGHGAPTTVTTPTGAASHTYSTPGSYRVVLTTTDTNGNTRKTISALRVKPATPPPPPPPLAELSILYMGQGPIPGNDDRWEVSLSAQGDLGAFRSYSWSYKLSSRQDWNPAVGVSADVIISNLTPGVYDFKVVGDIETGEAIGATVTAVLEDQLVGNW